MLDRLYQHQAFESVGKEREGFKTVFKADSLLYRFSGRADKAIRPLSSYNGHTKAGNNNENGGERKVTAEDVWLAEFFSHLAKLIRLDSPADIQSSIDVSHVITNTLNAAGSCKAKNEAIPEFVRSAIEALEKCKQ